ncbi:hypothetical protein [Roseiarcus sp.]|uniref:hypothetical protein n=1 Tax=Roseiarcus sp. TaxID=1969460 RepID=UPI003C7502D8
MGPRSRASQAARSRLRRRAARAGVRDERPGEQSAYTRLLGDAMAGEGALFTREDAVEAAWAAAVEPILKVHPRAHPL